MGMKKIRPLNRFGSEAVGLGHLKYNLFVVFDVHALRVGFTLQTAAAQVVIYVLCIVCFHGRDGSWQFWLDISLSSLFFAGQQEQLAAIEWVAGAEVETFFG